MGYTPPKGSLIGKCNLNNYSFSIGNEAAIIKWINDNLLINWVSYVGNINLVEKELIYKHLPLLNLQSNPGALQEVVDLRNKCKLIARS